MRVSVLPELGGRIYEMVFKPTGHNVLYRNPVLKPTAWGPPDQGWWLAAGGIEWCLPVEEHGYEWGIPWQFSTDQSGEKASVTVWDSQSGDRLRARLTIALEAGRSYVTISPLIENPTSQPRRFQFWLNAMLAPGGANRAGEAIEFIVPAAQVTVHSTGDRGLPQAGQALSWPLYNGRALSVYGTWHSFLGFFERPRAERGYIGLYDHASGEGVMRVYPPATAQGTKVFGGKGLDPTQWTDDGSTYVEIHGGVTPTFSDDAILAPGARLTWSERWYPFLAIGAASVANDEAALSLSAVAGGYRVGVAVTGSLTGRISLVMGGREVWGKGIQASPDHPFTETVTTSGSGVALRLEDSQGRLLLETADVHR